MYADVIRNYFLRFLGADVAITVLQSGNTHQVTIYRPDRLSDDFVQGAFRTLDRTEPVVAAAIDRLVIAYDTPVGRTQCRVSFPLENEAIQRGVTDVDEGVAP